MEGDAVTWEEGRGQDFGETFGVLLETLEHKYSTDPKNEPSSCIKKQTNGDSQNDSSSSVGESESPDHEPGVVKKEMSLGDEISIHLANEESDGDSPMPAKRQRFYFESDALALRNNPE